MKSKSLKNLLVANTIAIGFVATLSQSSAAQTPDSYFCGTSKDGVPTTYLEMATGKRRAIVRWVKNWNSNFPPQKRCEMVSKNFQQANESGELEYLTTKKVRGQTIICSTRRYGTPCNNVLFTVNEAQNPSEVIDDLEKAGYTAVGPLVQSEDGSPQIYIDWNKVLRQKAPEDINL